MAFVHLVPSILQRPFKRRAARISSATNVFAKNNSDVDGKKKAAKRVPPSDFADPTASALPQNNDNNNSSVNAESDAPFGDIDLDDQISRPASKKKRKNNANNDPVVPSSDAPIEARKADKVANIDTQFPSDTVPLVLDDKKDKSTPPIVDTALVDAGETQQQKQPPAADEPENVKVDHPKAATANADDKAPENDINKQSDNTGTAAAAAEKKSGSGIKLSPEEVAAASKRKAAEEAEAAKQREAALAARAKLFSRAQTAVAFVGKKTGVVQLGTRTRASLETYLDDIIQVKEGKDIEEDTNAKLKRTAAKAFRSLSTALDNQWKAKAVPAIKAADFVPDEAKTLDEKSLASASLGLFVAIALLPALLGGGSSNTMSDSPTIKKAVDRDTLSLQKKLEEKNSNSDTTTSTNADKAAERLIERRRREREEKLFPKTDPVPESMMPQLDDEKVTTATPLQPPPVVTPKAADPDVANDKKSKVEATPDIVLSAVRNEVGTKSAGFIKSATFDSLAAAPTVVLEASTELRSLGVADTKLLALAALNASRAYGYESVVVQEVGSGYEIARAGVDALVGDETAFLRAQVKALTSKVEGLAITNSEVTAKVDTLLSQIAEERTNTAEKIAGLNAVLKNAEAEKQELVVELKEAAAEIAAIPDTQVLEERTAAAEEKSNELTQTVETLSRQVTVARDAEKLAGDNLQVANNNARLAVEEKEAALKEADNRVENVRKEAADNMKKFEQDEAKARAVITEEAMKETQKAEEEVAAARNEIERVRKEDAAVLERTKNEYEKAGADKVAAFEKELAAVKSEQAKALDLVSKERDALAAEKARELKDVRSEYEKELAEVRTSSEKRETALKKELDGAVKATEKQSAETVKGLERDLEAVRTENNKLNERAAYTEELKEEVGRVRAEKKEVEKERNEGEKNFAKRLDDLKKEYMGKLDDYARESDRKLKETREEARTAADAFNAKLKDAEKDTNNLNRQVMSMTKERDELKKSLDKARAKSNNSNSNSDSSKDTPASSQLQDRVQAQVTQTAKP